MKEEKFCVRHAVGYVLYIKDNPFPFRTRLASTRSLGTLPKPPQNCDESETYNSESRFSGWGERAAKRETSSSSRRNKILIEINISRIFGRKEKEKSFYDHSIKEEESKEYENLILVLGPA